MVLFYQSSVKHDLKTFCREARKERKYLKYKSIIFWKLTDAICIQLSLDFRLFMQRIMKSFYLRALRQSFFSNF